MFATALLSQIPTPRWLDIRFKLGIRLLKSSEFGFWKLNYQNSASLPFEHGWVFTTAYIVEFPTPSWVDIRFNCTFFVCKLHSQSTASSIFYRGWLFGTFCRLESPTPSWADIRI